MLPLVNRTTKAFSSWLAPAWGGRLELKADLDQVEGLSAEREALWARLNGVGFLTVDEKRAAVGYGPAPREPEPAPAPIPVAAFGGGEDAPFVKYSPDQPRVPAGDSDGGQWTDGGGGGGPSGSRAGSSERVAQADTGTRNDAGETQVAQGRGGRRNNGGRTDNLSARQRTQLEHAEARLSTARARLTELDPEWQPQASARRSEPADIEARIRGVVSEALEAEARLTVVERGGVPLGFRTKAEFEEFGRTAWDRLAAARHSDAEPFIEGSAVTGYKYTTGEAFDVGRRSDYDLAIVSRTLMRRARDLGVELRSGGTRTRSLKETEIRDLELEHLVRELSRQSDRRIGVMIYESKHALGQRGPSLPLP